MKRCRCIKSWWGTSRGTYTLSNKSFKYNNYYIYKVNGEDILVYINFDANGSVYYNGILFSFDEFYDYFIPHEIEIREITINQIINEV